MTPATKRKKSSGFLRASFSPFLFGCFLFQPHRIKFTTTKNRKNTPGRMELKKYNPILKKMTVHKEIK